MYCDINGKIPSFLNNCLQECLGLELVIILITLFCSQKTWLLCAELPCKYHVLLMEFEVGNCNYFVFQNDFAFCNNDQYKVTLSFTRQVFLSLTSFIHSPHSFTHHILSHTMFPHSPSFLTHVIHSLFHSFLHSSHSFTHPLYSLTMFFH